MKKNIKKIVTLGLTLALSAQGVAALASDADVQKVVVAHTNYYVPYDFEDEDGNDYHLSVYNNKVVISADYYCNLSIWV